MFQLKHSPFVIQIPSLYVLGIETIYHIFVANEMKVKESQTLITTELRSDGF